MNQISQHNRKALRQDNLVVRGPRTLIWVWLACALACVTFATPGTVQAMQQGKSDKSDKSDKSGKSGKSGKGAPVANEPAVSEEGVIHACYIPKQGSVYRIKEAGLRNRCFSRKHVEFSFNTEGPAGPAGDPGADGADGAPGADGNDGSPGANGADGNDGAPGANGADGQNGVSGHRLLTASFPVPRGTDKLGQFNCESGGHPGDRVFGGGYEVTGALDGYFVIRNAPNGDTNWIVWIRNTNTNLDLTVTFHAICGKA